MFIRTDEAAASGLETFGGGAALSRRYHGTIVQTVPDVRRPREFTSEEDELEAACVYNSRPIGSKRPPFRGPRRDRNADETRRSGESTECFVTFGTHFGS